MRFCKKLFLQVQFKPLEKAADLSGGIPNGLHIDAQIAGVYADEALLAVFLHGVERVGDFFPGLGRVAVKETFVNEIAVPRSNDTGRNGSCIE